MENIYVRNIDVGQCGEAVLRINLVYEPGEICKRDFSPYVRNVYLENVNCRQSRYGVFITGYEESANISNIYVSDCEWTNVKEDNRLQGLIDNIRFTRTSVNGTVVKL